MGEKGPVCGSVFVDGVGRSSLSILMALRASEAKMPQHDWLPVPGMGGVQDNERFWPWELGGAILGDSATFKGMGIG